MSDQGIAAAWARIEAEVAGVAQKVGRDPRQITVVAVSKHQDVHRIIEYCRLQEGFGNRPAIGENYVQEFMAKLPALEAAGLGRMPESHLIGPLQSNKVRKAVQSFDVIESVHRFEVLELIASEAARAKRRVPIFLQVNISNDPKKSGFSREQVGEAVEKSLAFSTDVELRGLMTIVEWTDSAESARPHFRGMAELRTALLATPLGKQAFKSGCLLSMGMSADFGIAIEEGADLIRVGTRLFGAREYPTSAAKSGQ